MLKHIRWDEIETEQLNPKLMRQFFNSGGVTMARLTMAAGLVVPTHHHGSEQITNVVQGSIKMWLEGKEYLLRAGDVLCIPANLPHTTEVLEDAICLDVFSPPRTDWLAGEDSYLRGTGFGASSELE